MIVNGEWHAGVGDPTIWGWSITTGYATSAILCGYLAAADQPLGDGHRTVGKSHAFWMVLCAVLFLLGINKQLDVQTLLWLKTRVYLRETGTYNLRLPIQIALISAVLLCGSALLLALIRLGARRTWGRLVVTSGVLFLVCFVSVRTISAAPVDKQLAIRLGLWSVNEILEGGGVCLVLIGSIISVFRAGTAKSSSPIAGRSADPEPGG